MIHDPAWLRLCLITDRTRIPAGRTLPETVEAALAGGVRMVQLREKDLGADALYRLARTLKHLTARYGARLLINDRIDVALAAEADGVHLGEQSLPTAVARGLLGPQAVIGRSTHHPQAVARAAAQGADFVTFSPIYPTPSKAAYGPPQGVEALRRVCVDTPLPVLALGGMTCERIHEVRAAGAAGVALISAVMAAPDPQMAARQLLSAMG